MPHRCDPRQLGALLAAGYHDVFEPAHLVALLPLRTYQVVADIGCGIGQFTIPLAKYLFDGKVYAVESRKELLDSLAARLQQLRLTNVELIHSAEAAVELPEDTLDGALVPFVLHEVEDRRALFSRVLALLRKGGWLAILEWQRREMEEGPPLKERIERTEVEELARAAGFRAIEHRDLTTKQYMVTLRK